MIYFTAEFSGVLPKIWFNLRMRGRQFKREEYRHFSTERFCFKVMPMFRNFDYLRIYWRRLWNL